MSKVSNLLQNGANNYFLASPYLFVTNFVVGKPLQCIRHITAEVAYIISSKGTMTSEAHTFICPVSGENILKCAPGQRS